jgi:hypothetical protein
MRIVRLTDSFVRPASATQYTAGDEVSSHATAGSVVLPVFTLDGFNHGHVHRASLTITPASGNLVITAADFDLILFKTDDIIAAVGDNAVLSITAANRQLAIARFRFANGAWMNPLGALTASTSGFQEVAPTLTTVQGNSFEFTQGETESITAVVQAIGAWNPTAVANTFGIELEIDVD